MGEFEIHQPEKSSNRTIRMPDELIERMGKIAASKGISFNQLVIQCWNYALDNLKSDDNE